MARVSIYLNFQGNAEEAFEFYATAFNSQVTDISRFGDHPTPPGVPSLPEGDLDKIMNMRVEILAGTVLMGTDVLESMGQQVRIGNNTTINLELDSFDEAARLYDVLSQDSTENAPLQEMFWGAWWGVCLDKFGIRWMFNAPA